MKKLFLIAVLLLVSSAAVATQTSVWRSTLTRGTSGTFVQNVDAATPEAALQACHILVPNTASALTDYTCNAAKRVYRVTPELPAVNNVEATALSSSVIAVDGDALSGAAAYLVEQCRGSTCTTFARLTCSSVLPVSHSSLVASTTYRYRVRASRDSTCSTTTYNLGISLIVNGTTQASAGSASLRWEPPTQNTDGTALTNLAGYRVFYGRTATELTSVIQISNVGVTAYTVSNLSPGDYYFAVKAFNSTGVESGLSNIERKTII